MPDRKKIVEIRHFKMKFGNKTVIKDLSFDVFQGEVFGFLGSNGSGKTTTLRALLGLYEPTAGELLIDSKPYAVDSQINLGYLPEERGQSRFAAVYSPLPAPNGRAALASAPRRLRGAANCPAIR
jgi:ABC-type uncharacterized transport system ATPase subunit